MQRYGEKAINTNNSSYFCKKMLFSGGGGIFFEGAGVRGCGGTRILSAFIFMRIIYYSNPPTLAPPHPRNNISLTSHP